MVDDINIPSLDGYISIKEAASRLGVSDKRVYQYVMSGRLSAQRIGHILIIPVEEVNQFKPGPSGRVREKAPAWRVYRSGGTLLMTDIRVQVRTDQQVMLMEKLKAIQEAESHTFPGTVARYITKGDPELKTVQIFLVWKDIEMPDATLREQHLKALQDELGDMLVWETAQYRTNEVIIHT